MTPINEAYLTEQFHLMQEYLKRAREIARRPDDHFLADYMAIDAAVRQITVLFETAHNIAKHIIAQQAWKQAKSKAQAFEVLAESGVLSAALADAFKKASGFRNLVTYQTAMIDHTVVLRVLREHLGDFQLFLNQVAEWISKQKP